MIRALIPALLLVATPAQAYTVTQGKSIDGVSKSLLRIVTRTEHHFHSPAKIISGCRSRAYNRKIGGAPHSYHIGCKAVDFQVKGVSGRALFNYLSDIHHGGVGWYVNCAYNHIDTGPRRNWHW